jgi:hypothetical protein
MTDCDFLWYSSCMSDFEVTARPFLSVIISGKRGGIHNTFVFLFQLI